MKDLGLETDERDIAEVKNVKSTLQSLFEPMDEYISDFDLFAVHKFSKAETLNKLMTRVGNNLANAELLEVQSTREKDKEKSVNLRDQAKNLRAEAYRDKDSLIVLRNNALKEFVKSPKVSSIMDLLEANANQQRQIAQLTGRPEMKKAQTGLLGPLIQKLLKRQA